jgi:hypothetical protein
MLPYPPRPMVRPAKNGIYFETRGGETMLAKLTRNGWRVAGQNRYTRRWYQEYKGEPFNTTKGA